MGRGIPYTEYQSGKYRLTRMTDSVKTGSSYPNYVNIYYYNSPYSIVIKDRFNRTQTIYLLSDATAVPATVVGTVVLSGFGGSTLRYQFSYEVREILRSCKANCSAYGLQTRTVRARFLKSVVAFDANNQELERWEFPEYHWLVDSCQVNYGDGNRTVKDVPGVLRKYVLPTKGQVSFQWDDKTFYDFVLWPRCGPSTPPASCLPHVTYQTATAVTRKELLDPFRNQTGAFEYRFFAHDRWYNKNGKIYEFADELVTVVRDPLGNESAHFFAPGVDNEGLEDRWYGGLNFTRLQGDSTGSYLARKSFKGRAKVLCGSGEGTFCDAQPDTQANPESQLLRAEYVLYETSTATEGPEKGNRRLRNNRTYYLDDPGGCAPPSGTSIGTCRYAGVVRNDYDGYGHYRWEETEGNFPGNNKRVTYTFYNPSNPAPWLLTNWILNTFGFRSVTEAGKREEQRACFDASTGLLLRQRKLSSLNGSLQGNDVVNVFTYDSSGNLASAASYGGDVQAVISTDPYVTLCSLPLPAVPAYKRVYQTQYGVRSREAWVDPSTNGELLVTLDLTIDPSTGLPASSRDSSGMETQYVYDALRRLTWVKPQPGPAGSPGGGGWTQVEYVSATAANLAKVRVSTCAAFTTNSAAVSAPLARQTYFYDGLGRLMYHYRLIPQETSRVAFRRFDYNPAGWKTFESEWHRMEESITFGTRWQEYDPFGRPLRIQAADGKTTTFAYTGVRLTARTVSVATSFSGESAVTVIEEYDRQGRLVKVDEPSGPSGARVATTYSYNVLGKLVGASTSFGGVTQTRQWSYDGRAFMTAEQLPEKGITGGGWVWYQNFDALGNPARVLDGPSDLSFVYDKAGRVVEVKETLTGRVLKSFAYATDNVGSDMRKGKLVQAVANNYFDPADPSANFQVVEGFAYGGTGGKVSQKTTTVGVVGGFVGTFTQSFGWTDLWELAWQSYPRRAGMPSRTLVYEYNSGFLSAVREGTQVLASMVYHPNGMVATRVRSNGTKDVVLPDPSRMPRPANIQVQDAAGSVLWQTGVYAFDGVGNIKAMGGDRFAYDGVLRLVQARVGGQSFQASYNAFGFLTGMGKNGVWQTFVADASGQTNRISGASYDAAGNMLSWGGRSFSWYPTGSLRQVAMAGYSATYGYDAKDERVAWALILEAIASPTIFKLSLVRSAGDVFLGKKDRFSNAVILDMADIESAESKGGVDPSTLDHAMNLFHELGGHALRGLEDTFYGAIPEPGQVERLIMNPIRTKLGLPPRTRYERKDLGQRRFFLEFGGPVRGLVFTDF